MIFLFLLLLTARFAGNIAKHPHHDIRRSMTDDNAAVNTNEMRHVRSGTSSGEDESACSSRHYQGFDYPCSSDHTSTTCKDVGPAIATGYNNDVYSDCFCDSQCTNSNNEMNNGVSEDDSTLTWLAHNSIQATLMVNWTTSLSGTANPVGYQLWVYMIRGDASILRCICLPLNTTSYLANVSLTLSFSIQAKLVALSQPTDGQGCAADSVLSIKAKIPHYCWDLEEASVEKCGPMFASSPQNLAVVSRQMNESSVMLLISWEPPAHYAPGIEAYMVSVNGKCHCNNGTTLQFITFEFADVSSYIVKVSASSGQVTSYHGIERFISPTCCPHVSRHNYWSPNFASVTYYPHTTISSTVGNSAATDATVTDTMMMNTNTMTTDNMISTTTSLTTNVQSVLSTSTIASTNSTNAITHKTLVIVTSVGATISLILLILIIIVAVYLYQQKSRTKIYRLVPKIRVTPSQAQPKVFIVTDSDFGKVRELCHHLSDHNINCMYYKYEENNREDGPGQLGIVAWTERCFNESNMVLFVCNHGFNSVWENKPELDGQDPYCQIISTSKQLFNINLQSEDFSKYAVILLNSKESDRSYIPTLLRNVRSYPIADQESLARYILQIPEYIPPN